MLGRSIARALVADAGRLGLHTSRFLAKDAHPSTAPLQLLLKKTMPSAFQVPRNAIFARAYATAQPKPRKPTSRRSTAVNSKGRKTTARKTTAKKTKKKPAAKKKAKKTTKAKKPQTELEKQRAKVRKLKQDALLDTPKMLPATGYTVFAVENSVKGTNAAVQARNHSNRYRNLSASERQHLDNIANENKRANERTLRLFVQRHTPIQIHKANNARKQLNRIANEPKPSGSTRKLVGHRVRLLGDERALKKPETPYIRFFKDRHASGDLNGMPVTEAAKAVGREWRNLSSADAKKYHDAYANDKAQYDREASRVYAS